jgi:winged helix DNA-binding protein
LETHPFVTRALLDLKSPQILAFRRHVGALDERLPPGPSSLRRAAWAGLQDSMPRAALLSIHARVKGTKPSTWEDPSLVQLWGPRYNVFVVAARDVAVFTLGVFPDDAKGRRRVEEVARRLHDHLGGARASYADVGHALGVNPNSLRYASPTGMLLIRWEGARRPTVWTVKPPSMGGPEARLELARRYLHIFGPATPEAFGWWSGIGPRPAAAAFEALGKTLTPVRTSVGDAWILAGDEPAFRSAQRQAAPARLLPSGDAFLLFHGLDRELLIPDPTRRRELWTPRVWPGGVLVDGEVVGTWRRAGATLSVRPWIRLSKAARKAVEVEAAGLPLPGVRETIRVRWES